MKINIVEKKEKPLLYRTEVKLEVEFDAEVPSRAFLRKQVAKALGADESMVLINAVETKFGMRRADVLAHIYKDKKKMEAFVEEHMQKRHATEEKKGA